MDGKSGKMTLGSVSRKGQVGIVPLISGCGWQCKPWLLIPRGCWDISSGKPVGVSNIPGIHRERKGSVWMGPWTTQCPQAKQLELSLALGDGCPRELPFEDGAPGSHKLEALILSSGPLGLAFPETA